MTLTQIKDILVLIAILLVSAFLWTVHTKLKNYDEMKVAYAATVKQVADLTARDAAYDQALLDKSALEQQTRAIRNSISSALQDAHHEDVPSASYLDSPIPDRVREAYRRQAPASAEPESPSGTDRHRGSLFHHARPHG